MDRPRTTPPVDDGDDAAARRPIRLNVHGLAVELRCGLPGLRQVADDWFGPLAVDGWPEGFHSVDGSVEPYDADAVARHLSPQAERVTTFGDSAELWRDEARSWLIDDAWGICEVNPLKRHWRSWVLPQAELDPVRAVEQAVLWPMAQVLTSRGLGMAPAASVVHRGRGVLLLSPFNLEPELTALAAAGHGLIGPRWTAVREEEDGRAVLLAMPGRVERSPRPQLRSLASATPAARTEWVDLAGATPCRYAWCDLVLLIEPGRRAMASSKALTGASATAAVRHAWPMPDLGGPAHRQAQLATRLAQRAGVHQVELSRDPRALLRVLENIDTPAADRPRVQASVHVGNERRAVAV